MMKTKLTVEYRKPLVLAATVAVAVALINASHLLDWPMYEWFRLLLFVPVAYAGSQFRRAGAIAVSLSMIILLMPAEIKMMQLKMMWGINFELSALTLCVIGVHIGTVIRKQREDTETVERVHGIVESLRRSADPEVMLDTLCRLFRETGASDRVEIFLCDDDGSLLRRNAPESEPPLPADHLFHDVIRSGEFFLSNFVPVDPRLERFGDAPDAPSLIAVFPLSFAGKSRGVIALADSTHEHFNKELVSFLEAIKKSTENSLDLIEKRKSILNHELRRTKLRDSFASYVSAKVSERILEDPDGLALGGELRDVTVMFACITNFKDLSARIDPGVLFSMLNDLFSASMDVIFDHEGTLDKFLADGLMAFWGAPVSVADAERRAVACAVSLQQRLEALGSKWAENGWEPFHLSIGINTGNAVAGMIGSIRRMEYTIIGDTVNLAARIRSLSCERGIRILVGEETHRRLAGTVEFTESFSAPVKGKSHPITVHQLSAK